MAEQITNDVVKEAQSMGGPSLIDDTATTPNSSAGNGETPSGTRSATSKPSEALPTTSNNATSADAAQDSAHVSEKAGTATGTAPKETKEQLVNGDLGEHSASESQQAFGDASGGSDTDISRPGSVDQAKRASGHLRSNSVKKPASFKSVSVTKNFLAKSAVSTPAARPGEKTTPPGQTTASTQQTARPRLVAKSGSGNAPRSLTKMNGAGSGPDASKVWNKNQPVPPPPPKQFTDEELKQQYGIHLATRLQADEAGKEAKWADIDDDEDDWAPDTVQWMDGTKSTLAAVENQPPPEEPKPATKDESPTETPKPTPPPATNSSVSGGTKTILKPGAHSQSSPAKSGLILKGQPEKPTLVAKPSSAAPVKSPWATLPPVEKVSPVQINPPSQQPPPSRFSQRDSHGYDSLPPPLSHTKEIAPDDFNRSWRDDRGNRELFNSHSGRYEPVNDMRRGSARDSSFRQQPSVLQRPPHDGPAEPSAAFQTSRTSADGPAWGRRRNSSIVSGGSGRRMSIDRKGSELPPVPLNIQRRGSHSVNGADATGPGTPRQAFAQKAPLDLHHPVPERHSSFAHSVSPSMSHVQPVSPLGSVSSTGNQDAVTPGTSVQQEDPVEIQKRLMAEKMERTVARKRKEKEDEEKEEAARKERLQKKIAALAAAAAADDTKSKAKDPSPSRATQKSPHKEKAVPAPVQSPPKPPVPTSEGEVAQYGMMKVHQPHPVKKQHHPDLTATSKHVPKPTPSPVKAQAEAQPKTAPSLTQPPNSFTRDTDRSKLQAEQSQPQGQQTEVTGSQGLKPTQPSQSAWSSTLSQQSRSWTSNVWGPPQSKDRALGNGTFDSGYNRGQPRSSPQQLPPQPQSGAAAPIGLSPSLKPSPAPPQAPSNQSFTQQTMYSKTSAAPAQANAVSKPGPIAPPASAEKGWGNFAAHIRRDDQDIVAKARQDLERLGGESFRPELRETYTDQQGKSQTTLHSKIGGNTVVVESGAKSKISLPVASSDLKPKDEISRPASEGPSPAQSLSQGAHLPPPTQGARSSRFFPRPSEPVTQQSTSSKHDSPPPPETETHPAFAGDASHPVIKLPRPSPIVKLPPAAAEPVVRPDAPVSMPSRTRLGLGAKPLALTQEWQARFNSLLDKPTPAPAPISTSRGARTSHSAAHTKPGSLAVAAASKAPLDVRENLASATVSLPASRKIFAEDDSSEVITRTNAEEILLEEREFGSLPIVKLSKVSHLAANEPPVGFPPTYRPNSKFGRSTDPFSKPAFNVSDIFEPDRNADTLDVIIRLRNMSTAVTKAIARKRSGHKGPRPNKPKRNFTPNATSPNSQNPRSRKPSSYQSQGSNSNSSPRSNGWSNNRSTPPHSNTNNTWARRAASAAPVH